MVLPLFDLADVKGSDGVNHPISQSVVSASINRLDVVHWMSERESPHTNATLLQLRLKQWKVETLLPKLHIAILNMSTKMTTTTINNSNHQSLDSQLDKKLRELSLLKTPERTRRLPTFIGDDDDRSGRAPRSLCSPSPRTDERHRAEAKEQALAEMTDSYKSLLRSIGEDPTRQGLLKTPARAAKALLYFTKGYDEKIGGKTSHILLWG